MNTAEEWNSELEDKIEELFQEEAEKDKKLENVK